VDISKLLDWLKLSPKYLIPISAVTGFVLFAPTSILSIFSLVALVSQYRPYLGGIFLMSSALLVMDWLTLAYKWIKEGRCQSQTLKKSQRRLHGLTEEEKAILRGYIRGKTRTQYFSVVDGVVRGLEAEYIIFKVSNIGHPYNIQPWAWEYLNEHPELLLSNQELASLRCDIRAAADASR